MKRIAIIGANGQVGSEVSLLLDMMPGVSVVPICRTRIGSAFLRKAGLEVRHAAPSDGEAMKGALKDCDVVADFSLPVGAASEVREVMGQIIPNLAGAAPAGAPLVYLSSITAFGIRDFHGPLRYHRFSRNVYGSCKRFGEKQAFASARKTGRPAYVLRVGVVHGDLQAVTRKTEQQVRTAGGIATHVPDCESYAVFAVTIAEALTAIAQGKESPGLYTMLPNPGVTWKALHEWYCRRVGVTPEVRLLPADPAPSYIGRALGGLMQPATRLVFANKDVIAGYLTAAMPGLENRFRSVYHLRNAGREICEGQRASQYRPYGNNQTVFPGERVIHLTDPLEATDRHTEGIRRALRRALGVSGGGVGIEAAVLEPTLP